MKRPTPTRLIIVVEGTTEDNFVRHLLAPHLHSFGVHATSTIVGKAKAASRGLSGRGKRGGGCYANWKRDIRNCLKDNASNNFRLTTLFDLYGLPNDFPGREEHAGNHDSERRCERLERTLHDDVRKSPEPSTQSEIGAWRFIPYIQKHEFEALFLASIDQLEWLYDSPENLTGIQHLREDIAGLDPENINQSPATHPSDVDPKN